MEYACEGLHITQKKYASFGRNCCTGCLFMFTETHFPQELPQKELDEYLARGWFRMGQTIFTCHYLYVENNLYPTVWIRQHLPTFAFRKSQRKMLRRHQRQYTVQIRKATINSEKDALFQRHKHRLANPVPDNLQEYLLEGGKKNIYASQEVAIYEADRLIAFSFFDLGKKSIASIMGVFDPDYERESLGYYTLLEEITFGMHHGYEWYYPGYVVPGYDRFEYKLRTGPAEYFDVPSQSWHPYEQLSVPTLSISILKQRMHVLHQLLTDMDFPHEIMVFPGRPHLKENLPLNSPLCIHIRTVDIDWLVDHEVDSGIFRLFRVGEHITLIAQETTVLNLMMGLMRSLEIF